MSDLLDTRHGEGLAVASFTLRHRAFRALWRLTWLLLAAWTPPPLFAWRRWLLQLFGADLAEGARVYGSARIWYPPNLVMGRNAAIGWHTEIYCQDRIILGDFAVVSQYAHLVTGTHDVDNPGFRLHTSPIRIGRHAWVAANAFVGPGVVIGEGAVLGACAVAFKDLPAWTIHAGNPARYVRDRKLEAHR